MEEDFSERWLKIFAFTAPVLLVIFYYTVIQQKKVTIDINKQSIEFDRDFSEFNRDFSTSSAQKKIYAKRASLAEQKLHKAEQKLHKLDNFAKEFDKTLQKGINDANSSSFAKHFGFKNKQ